MARRDVEGALGCADEGSRSSIDPHGVRAYGSPASRAVTYFALYPDVPTYATLMYVVHTWREAGRSLKEWIVAQYAALVDGEERLREAALYSLWVDYFEVPERAAFVFPRLVRGCSRLDVLLADSGPVPWKVKIATYRRAAAEPALHASLALGIARSFHDVYGSVDPVEARALVRQIEIADATVRGALEEAFTPSRWLVTGVATVDESDERWRQWLHASSDEPSFLISMRVVGRHPPWVYGSEVRRGPVLLGRLVHMAIPFDRAIRHRLTGELAGTLFRIEGDRGLARDSVGGEVEVWPPGLFDAPG